MGETLPMAATQIVGSKEPEASGTTTLLSVEWAIYRRSLSSDPFNKTKLLLLDCCLKRHKGRD